MIDNLLLQFEYNYWARDQILAAAAKIEPAELTAKSMPSYETVLGVLTHTLNAEILWRNRCQTPSSPSSIPFKEPLENLTALKDEWSKEEPHMLAFIRSLDDKTLQSPIVYQGIGGKAYSNLLWQILTQLVHHGLSHRSELAYKLTELGHSPGNLDFIIYLRDR